MIWPPFQFGYSKKPKILRKIGEKNQHMHAPNNLGGIAKQKNTNMCKVGCKWSEPMANSIYLFIIYWKEEPMTTWNNILYNTNFFFFFAESI